MNVRCQFAMIIALVFSFSVEAAQTNQMEAKGIPETTSNLFKFGGFATLGVAHSSQGQGDYVIDSTLPKGPGRSSNWSVGNDSRIGVQISANFTPQISSVLQVISEYQADNSYNPSVEWANVKYDFSADAYIRLGRIALPTFLNSDTRKVGHSYPWVHPPVELYRVLAITSSDGIDARYRFEMGDAINSVKIMYGSNEIERPTSISTSRNMWGFFDRFEYGDAMLRIGYQQREASSYRIQTGIAGPWIPNSDLSVGASYDTESLFMLSEWIQRKSTTKLSAMYVSGGVRIDNFMPYLTYSNNSKASFLPGFPTPTAASIVSAEKSQSTISLGMRWDFMKNMDFKLQYDQVRLRENTNGYLINLPPGAMLYGSKFHVISAAVDCVF